MSKVLDTLPSNTIVGGKVVDTVYDSALSSKLWEMHRESVQLTYHSKFPIGGEVVFYVHPDSSVARADVQEIDTCTVYTSLKVPVDTYIVSTPVLNRVGSL